MTPEEEIYRSNRAREVLENEEYTAAFAAIEQEIQAKWKQSPARDSEGRERLWVMLKLLEKLQLTLAQTMDSGKLAMANLGHQQTLRDRAKSWLKGGANDGL